MNLYVLIAQTSNPTGGWDQVFAVYGPFAPFAICSVIVIWTLWKRLLDKEAENKELHGIIIDRVVPLVTTSSATLAEATELIQRQSETTRQILEVGDQLSEVLPLLKKFDKPTPRRRPTKKA